MLIGAGMFLAVFALGLPLLIFGMSVVVLLILLPVGAVSGYFWEKWTWSTWPRHLRKDARIFLDAEFLRVKGATKGGLSEVRFRRSDISAMRIGSTKQSSSIPQHYLHLNFDEFAMTIQEHSGASIRFELIGAIFRPEDLAALSANLGASGR